MQCRARIKYQTRRRKGSGEEYQKMFVKSFYPTNTDEDGELCGGDLVATVRAVDEPSWGYTHAILETDIVCAKCGTRCYELDPFIVSDEDTVSWVFTQYIQSHDIDEMEEWKSPFMKNVGI